RVQARYPQRDLHVSYGPDETIGRGDQGILLNIPVGFGDCFLDFWLLDGDAVVDWYTEAVHRDGWPEMTDVAFSSLAIEANDRLEISLNVRSHYHRPRPCTVFVRATDSLGRIVAERSVLVGKEGGPATVELQLVDLIAPYLKVEVFAADTIGGPLSPWLVERSDYAFAHVLVRRNAPSSFRFVADGLSAAEFGLRRQNRVLARHGVDSLHTSVPAGPLGTPALDNLDVIPALGSYSIRSWSSEPQLRSDLEYELREQAQRYRIFGPGLYLLKIKPLPPVGGRLDVNAEAYFQELPGFLAGIYPNIAALNRAWESAFLDWEEAAATALRGPDSISARMDLSSFVDDTFLKVYGLARGAIRDVDEGARVGVEIGSTELENDVMDAPMMARRIDFMLVPPDRLAAGKIRSYRSEGATAMLRLHGAPTGLDEHYTKWLPWFAALHGLDGVWIGRRMGPLAPRDAKDTGRIEVSEQQLGTLAREVRVVQSGIAELLKRARPLPSGIALYDSRSSGRMDRLLPVGSYTSRMSQERFAHLLDSFGYQYDFVDYEAVIEGGLENYALCVLPFTRALSDEEVQALEAFYRGGGALMADLLPGRYDEHGTQREPNRLQEIFGVEAHEELHLGPLAPLLLEQTPKRGRRRKDTSQVASDRSIRGTHAGFFATSGDAPIVFVAGNAPGHAMLLNYRLDDPVQELDRALRDWLEDLGVTKRIPESLLELGDFPGEVAAFDFSGAYIYGFLRDPGGKSSGVRVRLTIDPDRHGYDLLSAKHYGPGSKVTFKMMPGEAALLCSLPYEVTRVLVAAPVLVGRGRR
ncbi:MAG: beta-galactosidase trimerization domain-containing protein, partial [Candidatus Hydrogenedentes bacterium]|nr:beta-galactosidase trimerization domain-containing protein [Candidatus Hydrogenedentota bacterium]